MVTGGCGFLGSAIVRALLERGAQVRVLALPGEATDNVEGLEVEIVRGDVRDPEACRRAVKDMDTVFHAAAIYKAFMPNPTAMYDVNHHGTFHMLEASRREGVEKVIYTASIVSIGRPAEGTLANEETAYDAWDIDFAYSRAKYHSRKIAEDFGAWGMDVRVVCPGMIFGPGDIGPTPSGQLILEFAKGAPPVYVDGGASYVDVRDAAEVHVLAAERGEPNERYVATAHNLNNYDFIQAIGRALGKEKRLFKVPLPAARGYVTAINEFAERFGGEPQLSKSFFEYCLKPSFFDNAKSRRELGATYRSIDETIGDAIAYFRSRGKL